MDFKGQIHPNPTAQNATEEVIYAKTGHLANRFGLKLAKLIFY